MNNLYLNLSVARSAYLAGIIDGEGSIQIQKHKNETFDNWYDYRVKVSITNTNIDLLNWVKDITNLGSISSNPKSSKTNTDNNWKICFRWAIVSNQAGLLLRQIVSYLVIKKEHANICIDYLDNARVKRLIYKDDMSHLPELRYREEAYKKLRMLNQRGKNKVTFPNEGLSE